MTLRLLALLLGIGVARAQTPGTVEDGLIPSYPFLSATSVSCPPVVGARVMCQLFEARPYRFPVPWAIWVPYCANDGVPYMPPDTKPTGAWLLASTAWCPVGWHCHSFGVQTTNPRQFIADSDCAPPDTAATSTTTLPKPAP